MDEDIKFELEYFRLTSKQDRRRALGSALIGIVDGCGGEDNILANAARRYVRSFRIVETED